MKPERAEGQTGVRILLSPNTQIPDWITSQNGVRVIKAGDTQGRVFPLVEIAQGEAEFLDAYSFGLRIGRERTYRTAEFGTSSVLEIQGLDGELIKRNHHMCIECMANTDKMVSYQPGEFAGKVNAVFQCDQNPMHKWEIKNL